MFYFFYYLHVIIIICILFNPTGEGREVHEQGARSPRADRGSGHVDVSLNGQRDQHYWPRPHAGTTAVPNLLLVA